MMLGWPGTGVIVAEFFDHQGKRAGF